MRLLPLALLLAVLLPATAQAGAVTLHTDQGCVKYCSDPWADFVATPGERNVVLVSGAGPAVGGVMVRDEGSPLTVEGCEQLDAHTARCPASSVSLVLGDGDDRAERTGGYIVSANGGDGDDVLHAFDYASGGPGDDRLTPGGRFVQLSGGDGDDLVADGDGPGTLDGGPGRDVVDAGGGDDIVRDSDTGADTLAGGAGRDVLSHAVRRTGTRIDLTAQATYDGDAMSGFESAVGGFGDDVLTGDGGPNALWGGDGHDLLVGGGGDDRLGGGAGFDRFDAGPGADRLDARFTHGDSHPGSVDGEGLDAQPEPLSCGPGRDRVVALDGDLVGSDCERLPLGLRPLPVRVRGDLTVFEIRCPRPRGCRGTIVVHALGGRPILSGRTAFRIRGRRGRVRVRHDLLGRREPHAIGVDYGRLGEPLSWAVPALLR